MVRRKLSRDAVRQVTDRSVAMTQVARDLGIAESVFRAMDARMEPSPAAVFPWNGQMWANLAKIAP